MKKKEYKQELLRLFSQEVDGMTFEERMGFIEAARIDFYAARDNEPLRDCSAKYKPWKDEELLIILQDAPTKANCLKYAVLFKRGYGSIEQIYRWAAASDERVEGERPDDAFVRQIKRVAKKIKWRI